MRRQYLDNGKTPLKATQNQVDHPEDGSTMPRAVAIVQSPLATRWIMLVNLFILVKLFFGSEVAADATQCSVSVCTVTAGSIIAALSAASWHAGNNGGAPIAATSKIVNKQLTNRSERAETARREGPDSRHL